ncbi:hypothetical protein LPN04_22305 [Rugamonas sp. A1-17]|nr:hypothetical protein [Rugamonas sp. A1-17]
MSTPIGSSTSTPYIPPASPQQIKSVGTDADGDHDGTKAATVEPPKATSGTIGTVINTTA